MKIGVIDIGSNSIRYMEAESSETGFSFSPKTVSTTRLAKGQGADGALSQASMDRSLRAIRKFGKRASDTGLPCFCYATSAVREASNRKAFLDAVAETAGLPVEVLTGDEEARIAYDAAMPDGGGLIDIGGGSFQVTTESQQYSYPLGCVRIRDLSGDQQTIAGLMMLVPPLVPDLSALRTPLNPVWAAAGGTATSLAAVAIGLSRYDADKISQVTFTQKSLEGLLGTLDQLGDFGRSAFPLLKNRYDTILGGGILLLSLMRILEIPQIGIADRDGLEGYAIRILSRQ